MSKRSVLKSVVYYGLAALFVAAALPVGAQNAEARRLRLGPKAMALPAAQGARALNNESADAAVDPVSGAQLINAAPVHPDAAQAGPATSHTARKAKAAANKVEVPGCGAGMMCTVCLAGCVAGPHSIVSSTPAPVEAEPVKAVPVAATVPTTPWSAPAGSKSHQDRELPIVKAKVPAPMTVPQAETKPMREDAEPPVAAQKPAAKLKTPVTPTAATPTVLPPLSNERADDKGPVSELPAQAPASGGPDIMDAEPGKGQ